MDFRESLSYQCAYAMEFLVGPHSLETEETIYYECGWDENTSAMEQNVTLPNCVCKG